MTTQTVEKKDYAELANKKVTVVRNLSEPDADGNGTVEIEGTVQVANEMGILIKPKGKVTFDLIGLAEIEDVYLTPDKDKDFVASKLKPVEPGKMRRHLLDRHGVALAWANQATEEEAVAYHDSLDHKGADLGHIHVEPKPDGEAAVEEPAES